MKRIKLFLKLSRPVMVLGGLMQYFLGLGVARFFRVPLHPAPVLLGGVIVLGILLAGSFFFAQFERTPRETAPGWLASFWGGGDLIGKNEGQLPQEMPILLAAGSLLAAGLALLYLVILGWVTPSVIGLISVLVVGMLLYVLPPFQAAYSGFGELLIAVLWAYAIPSLAYVLVAGTPHRYLMLISFPFVFLILSVSLIVSLPYYSVAEKYEKTNLLTRVGWENGMLLHNAFMFFAFFLLGLSAVFGLPVRLILPVFFVIPLVGLQIWYLNQISAGREPNWGALLGNALAIYGAAVYLLAYTFWIG